MNQQAYQIQRDRRVLVARPNRAECTGEDIASLVVDLCRQIDQGDADSVVIELNNVHHMDSCCLGRVVVLHQHTRAVGGSVALARCQPNVEFLFKMTRLDKVLGLYASTENAIAELRDRRTRPRPGQDRPDKSDSDTPRPNRQTRGYAPMIAALLRAHKRIHANQPVSLDPGRHGGYHS
jgi:anti-anti-sigma factor